MLLAELGGRGQVISPGLEGPGRVSGGGEQGQRPRAKTQTTLSEGQWGRGPSMLAGFRDGSRVAARYQLPSQSGGESPSTM